MPSGSRRLQSSRWTADPFGTWERNRAQTFASALASHTPSAGSTEDGLVRPPPAIAACGYSRASVDRIGLRATRCVALSGMVPRRVEFHVKRLVSGPVLMVLRDSRKRESERGHHNDMEIPVRSMSHLPSLPSCIGFRRRATQISPTIQSGLCCEWNSAMDGVMLCPPTKDHMRVLHLVPESDIGKTSGGTNG